MKENPQKQKINGNRRLLDKGVALRLVPKPFGPEFKN